VCYPIQCAPAHVLQLRRVVRATTVHNAPDAWEGCLIHWNVDDVLSRWSGHEAIVADSTGHITREEVTEMTTTFEVSPLGIFADSPERSEAGAGRPPRPIALSARCGSGGASSHAP